MYSNNFCFFVNCQWSCCTNGASIVQLGRCQFLRRETKGFVFKKTEQSLNEAPVHFVCSPGLDQDLYIFIIEDWLYSLSLVKLVSIIFCSPGKKMTC